LEGETRKLFLYCWHGRIFDLPDLATTTCPGPVGWALPRGLCNLQAGEFIGPDNRWWMCKHCLNHEDFETKIQIHGPNTNICRVCGLEPGDGKDCNAIELMLCTNRLASGRRCRRVNRVNSPTCDNEECNATFFTTPDGQPDRTFLNLEIYDGYLEFLSKRDSEPTWACTYCGQKHIEVKEKCDSMVDGGPCLGTYKLGMMTVV